MFNIHRNTAEFLFFGNFLEKFLHPIRGNGVHHVNSANARRTAGTPDTEPPNEALSLTSLFASTLEP